MADAKSDSGPRRILAIDVGAGTQDILLYDSSQSLDNSIKMVMPSRTVIVARQIGKATRAKQAVFLTGSLMGGGPSSRAVQKHLAAGLEVYATASAASTIDDNLNVVRGMGVIVSDEAPADAVVVRTGDVDLLAIGSALSSFAVDLPEEFAVAVQDHGHSPTTSNRKFRFEHWQEFVQQGGQLSSLAYHQIPAYLTRMKAVRRDVPDALLMDTGAAAIWGALGDAQAARRLTEGIVVVNVGNAHVLAALVQGSRIWGLFEHHSGDFSKEKLTAYVKRLIAGDLDSEEVLADGGHGAAFHPDYSKGRGFELVVVTGPNRWLARGLGYHMAVPHGDMMLSGCFGLLAGYGVELSSQQ